MCYCCKEKCVKISMILLNILIIVSQSLIIGANSSLISHEIINQLLRVFVETKGPSQQVFLPIKPRFSSSNNCSLYRFLAFCSLSLEVCSQRTSRFLPTPRRVNSWAKLPQVSFTSSAPWQSTSVWSVSQSASATQSAGNYQKCAPAS